MTIINKITIFSAAAMILSACGGGRSEKKVAKDVEVKPLQTSIEGYLGDYLEVVESNYTATNDKSMIFSWVIKVKIKAKAPYKQKDYGLGDGNDGPLYLDFHDKAGTPLAGFENFSSSYQDDEKLLNILAKGSGETWVTFAMIHKYNIEEYPEGMASFSVSSDKTEEPEAGSSKGSSSSSMDENADYDKFLDDYEEYVDAYLTMLKKANAGDMTAMAEYPTLYEKANDLGEDLEKAKGNMTPKQVSRMSKILGKMAKAATEMK